MDRSKESALGIRILVLRNKTLGSTLGINLRNQP
jgi:hypothetical protein